MKIFFIIFTLLAFHFSQAGSVCSADKVKELYEKSRAEDAAQLNKLLMDKNASVLKINSALEAYASVYGEFPRILDRMSGQFQNRQLLAVDNQGHWIMQHPDGRIYTLEKGFFNYALKENPNMSTTTNNYGTPIHKPDVKLKTYHGEIRAKDLGVQTKDSVVIGMGTGKEHAYMIVDGQRLESTGPLFGVRVGKARTNLVDKGTVFEIKNLSDQQKQGLKDYFKKREAEFKTNPIKAHIKNQGCVNTVCAALRDGADIDIKAPIFRQKMLSYLMKNKLVDSKGNQYPVEVYYTNINTTPARRRAQAVTRDIAHGGLFGTLGLSVGALAVVIHEKVILVSYDKVIDMLSDEEKEKPK